MNKQRITIAVTGLNATDSPAPGVPVIRAIRESGEFVGTIVGLAYDPLDPGAFMDGICDHSFLFPYPSEGAAAVLERIKEIHSRVPLDVIVPTLDAELNAFLKIQDDLEAMGIHTFLPHPDGLKLRSKATFAKLADTLDISVPRGMPLTDARSLFKLERDLHFPAMIKGQFYEAYLAHSAMEASAMFHKISAKWGLPVVAQEFIVGEEYDVVAVGDGTGGLIGAVPMRKMQLTDKGKAWGGVTIGDPKMNAFVASIMKKLKWRGPCELEIMKRTGDGKFFLIEINPRFPAWTYLAVGAGQNLPWAVVKLALGQKVEPFETYKVGTMFLRHSIDMIYPMDMYQSLTTAGEIHHEAPVDIPKIGVL